jgi:hypothetical protein
MRKEDIEGVAYRYAQTRRGKQNTFNEAVFWGIVTIVFFTTCSYLNQEFLDLATTKENNFSAKDHEEYERYINNTFNICKFLLLGFVANIIPNIAILNFEKTQQNSQINKFFLIFPEVYSMCSDIILLWQAKFREKYKKIFLETAATRASSGRNKL